MLFVKRVHSQYGKTHTSVNKSHNGRLRSLFFKLFVRFLLGENLRLLRNEIKFYHFQFKVKLQVARRRCRFYCKAK